MIGYDSLHECLMGCFVLYHLRKLETQWSSLRLTSFWFSHLGLTSALSLLGSSILRLPLQNGPQSFLLSLLIQYIRYIPPVYESHVLGFPINDHAFFYFMLSQLFVLSKQKSPFLLGLLFSILYSWNLFGVASWRLPRTLQNWIKPWLSSSSKNSHHPTLNTEPQGGETLLDENAIQMLVSMGFTRDQATEALRRCDTVEQAVAQLIDQR
jgi:hypothetical protein